MPSWKYAIDFRPLVALETLNTLSKFLVNGSCGCWVMKNCFFNEYWKVKSCRVKEWKGCGARKSKKAIFEWWRHPMSNKFGTLLHLSLSTCYGAVGLKLTFGIVIWSKISEIQIFTIFVVMPRHTLTYTYQEVFLQWSFRNYYLLRIASKLKEKSTIYTFSKFVI